jgi:hypothetical protein
VAAVVQGLLRPGYSFVASPVVALVAGPSGWVQDLNFVVLGAAMIAFAIGLQLGVLVRCTQAAPGTWRARTLGAFSLEVASNIASPTTQGRPSLRWSRSMASTTPDVVREPCQAVFTQELLVHASVQTGLEGVGL